MRLIRGFEVEVFEEAGESTMACPLEEDDDVVEEEEVGSTCKAFTAASIRIRYVR